MNDLISVIVPIYNVEKYLKKCIDSILNQSYKNLEIILVDDGSKDSSLSICKSYSDTRIKIFHKDNGGLSSARNAGLKMVTGKYICFIDSDDFISTDYIKKLYESIINSQSDLAVCKFNIVDEDNKVIKEYPDFRGKKILDIKKSLLKMIDENTFFVQNVWNKLYKSSIIFNNSIEFEEGRLYEDLGFTPIYLTYCKKISITNYCGYSYLKRASSIVGSENFSAREFDRIYMAEICYNTVVSSIPSLKSTYYSFLIHQNIAVYNLSLRIKDSNGDIELLKKIKKMIRLHLLSVWFSRISLKKKSQISLLFFFSSIYKKVYKWR